MESVAKLMAQHHYLEAAGWTPMAEDTLVVAIANLEPSKTIRINDRGGRERRTTKGTGRKNTAETRFLQLRVGDVIAVTHQHGDWYYGHDLSSSSSEGLVPKSYVAVRRGKDKSSSPRRRRDVLDELSESLLPVWLPRWKRLFTRSSSKAGGGREGEEEGGFDRLQALMEEAVDIKRQVGVGVLTNEQTCELKRRLGRCLESGGAMLGLEAAPRDAADGARVEDCDDDDDDNDNDGDDDGDDDDRGGGPHHLFKKYESTFGAGDRTTTMPLPLSPASSPTSSSSSSRSCSSLPPRRLLAVRLRRLLCPRTEEELMVTAAAATVRTEEGGGGGGEFAPAAFVTEQALLLPRLRREEREECANDATSAPESSVSMPVNVAYLDGLPSSSKEKTFVVLWFYRVQQHNLSYSSSTSFLRKPHGVAVAGPVDVTRSGALVNDSKIYLCEERERDFHHLHDAIIRGSAPLKAQWANAKVELVLQSVADDTSLEDLSKGVVADRMGFSGTIETGVVRNDFFFTLECASFDRSVGGKSKSSLVEVSATVLDSAGRVVPSCLSLAAGLPASDRITFTLMHPHGGGSGGGGGGTGGGASGGGGGVGGAGGPGAHGQAGCIWMETVAVRVGVEEFADCHVRLEYRVWSGKDKPVLSSPPRLFGFSFLRLMESDGTAARDGAHVLFVHRCEDARDLADPSDAYLPLASSSSSSPSSGGSDKVVSGVSMQRGFPRNHKERVVVSTKLCSSKLTQNVHLMALLNWKHNSADVGETLKKLIFVDGSELVKYLQDVLDALFEMFTTEDGNSTGHSGLVFQVLIHIISLLQQPKFRQFSAVMDKYINEHFSAALVYKGLLTCLRHFTDLAASSEKQEAIQEPIKKCFRSLECLVKLIVRSRMLFVRSSAVPAGPGQQQQVPTDASFRDSVKLLFDSFNQLVSQQSPQVRSAQVVFLRNVGSVLPHLATLVPQVEVADMASLVLGTVVEGPSSICDANLGSAALVALRQSVAAFSADSRARLKFAPVSLLALNKFLLVPELEPEATEALGEMLIFHHRKRRQKKRRRTRKRKRRERRRQKTAKENSSSGTEIFDKGVEGVEEEDEGEEGEEEEEAAESSEVLSLAKATLLPLIEAMGKNNSTENKRRLFSCLMSLLDLVEGLHRPLAEYLHACGHLRACLQDLLTVFHSALSLPVVPARWGALRASHYRVMLSAMRESAKTLLVFFREERTFDRQLWLSYFGLAATVLTQPDLQLEEMAHWRRRRKLEQLRIHLGEAGMDVRRRMGFQILSLWSHLGNLKQYFIPGMVGPLLKITLVPNSELVRASIPVLFDLMDQEYRAKGSFKQVESELVDKLDILVQEGKVDVNYKKAIVSMLEEVLEDRDPPWRESGRHFINSVTTLLERLLEYKGILKSEHSTSQHMSCIASLVHFYRSESNRQELYLRYVHKLYDLHVQADNLSEAALTLKLHADLLQWTNKTLHADLRYPSQKEWERKEHLLLRVVGLLERAKHWEHAIPICKELVDVYEHKVFEYRKLGEMLRRQAGLVEKIVSSSEQTLRLDPEYFMVAFRGDDFPVYLRNKDFVYRGLEFEKLPSFTQRLKEEFPRASVLPHSERLAAENGDGNGGGEEEGRPRIYVCCVQVAEEDEGKGEEGFSMPPRVRQSRRRMDVRAFRHDRPVHRGARDRLNEFKTLWIERTHLRTRAGFPSLLRWLEVDPSPRTELVPPVTHACEAVEAKTRELRRLASADDVDGRSSGATATATAETTQRLSLTLQGALDAAVNGGVARYREAFLDPGAEVPAELRGEAARLRRLMAEQVDVLECALTRHGRLVSSDMRPLHDHLCSRWRQMKEELSQLQQHQGEGSSPSPSPPVRTLSRRPSGSRRGPLPKPPPPSTATTTTMTMTAPIYESTCAEGEEEEEAAAEGLYSLPASVPVLAVATNGSTMAASPPPPPLVFLRQQHHRRQPPSWTSLSSSSSSTMMTASTPSTTSTAAATAAAPPLPPRVAGNTNRFSIVLDSDDTSDRPPPPIPPKTAAPASDVSPTTGGHHGDVEATAKTDP